MPLTEEEALRRYEEARTAFETATRRVREAPAAAETDAVLAFAEAEDRLRLAGRALRAARRGAAAG